MGNEAKEKNPRLCGLTEAEIDRYHYWVKEVRNLKAQLATAEMVLQTYIELNGGEIDETM